jgi:PKD repeat protein
MHKRISNALSFENAGCSSPAWIEVILILLALMCSIPGAKVVNAQGTPPPPLPSSFYGVIHIFDDPPFVGDTVQILAPDISGTAAAALIEPFGPDLVYEVNVPGDVDGTIIKEGGSENDPLTFMINGRIVATAAWHSGTSTGLNIHPPQALSGGPYVGSAENAIAFHGSANDWGNDATTYQWDWDDDGIFDETAQAPSHTFPHIGTYTVGLKVIDAQGGEGVTTTAVTVNKRLVPVTLGNLNQTYTSLPASVTITTVPAGLGYEISYAGSPTPPTNAGTYPVVVNITDPDSTGTAAGSLVISPAALAVTALPQSKTYGDTFIFTGSEFTSSGLLGSDTITSVTLSSDGTAMTAPRGSHNIFASSAIGTGLGNYFLTYVKGIFTVGPKGLTITANDQTKNYGETFAFLGTEFTPSGLVNGDAVVNVTLSSLGAVPAAPVGEYAIQADSATGIGLDNYDISYIQGTMSVTSATATIFLNDLNPTYDGLPKSPTVTTIPAGLSYTITYDDMVNPPSSTPPSNTGTYNVIVTITDPNYSGSASAVFVIVARQNLALVPGWNLVSFNVHPASTKIADVLSDISGNYSLVFTWDATGASSDNGNWKKYAPPPAPDYQNDLLDLDEKMGFWIYMTVADTLDIYGSAPSATDILLLNNTGGWNLVGYPSMPARDLPDALSLHGVGNNYTVVFAYHANDPTGDLWKLFDPLGTPFSNDLKQITSGWGYWINVITNSTWTLNYLPDPVGP